MIESEIKHPKDIYLRSERFPHIWCPGCGLGIVLKSYVDAISKLDIPLENHVLVSGIGCTARLPGYANVDSYHTTHGRAVAFATGMKIVNPDLQVTIISGDGDLFNIGGNHIIHAARRNMDLLVVCVNNFNYGMTGGQHGATTPEGARTSTTPYGNIEHSFNLPYIMASLGASYVARWTTLHVRQLTKSIMKGMKVKGFSFIEVVSPCPPNFGKLNNFPEGLDEMNFFLGNSVQDNNAKLDEIDLDFSGKKPIVVGEFVQKVRPSYIELEKELIRKAMEAP